jgi:hypothetical protein
LLANSLGALDPYHKQLIKTTKATIIKPANDCHRNADIAVGAK